MNGDVACLLLGIAAIVIVGRVVSLVPCVGDVLSLAVYLLSFALAVGGWLLTQRPPAAPVAQG